MATPEEILITQAALDAELAKIPDLSPFTVETGGLDFDHIIVPDVGWETGIRVRFARTGVSVIVTITGLIHSGEGSSWIKFMDMPEGFNPPVDVYTTTRRGRGVRIVSPSRELQVLDPATISDEVTLSFSTSEAAPNLSGE